MKGIHHASRSERGRLGGSGAVLIEGLLEAGEAERLRKIDTNDKCGPDLPLIVNYLKR